jgi:CPA1 family monovalent cation:H+ antiporter
MASIIAQLEIVLLVTAIVGMLARRLRVPTTVGLVVAGIGLALVPGAFSITLTKDLVFDAFLPPLVFEASLVIDGRELRKDLAVILTLVTLGFCSQLVQQQSECIISRGGAGKVPPSLEY